MRKRVLIVMTMLLGVLMLSVPASADFTEAAQITTIAGNGTAGYTGDGGPALLASMSLPQQMTFDEAGNIYIADRGNNVIRKIDTDGIITTVAGGGQSTENDIAATEAALVTPSGVVVDAAGNLFIAEGEADRVRVVDAQSGLISIYAGTGVPETSDGDDGPATDAGVDYPQGLALDSAGNLYIAEFDANKIRRVDAVTGVITTVAGNGGEGYTGDGGPATSATMNDPWDVHLDADDNIYIADFDNYVIRRVDAATGIITTAAGNGTKAFSGDGGPATEAALNWPVGVFVDDDGDMYIADGFNQRVRAVDGDTGLIRTLGGTGNAATSGDGGLAVDAAFNGPSDMWVWDGDLYILEVGGGVIRRVFETAAYPIDLTVVGDLGAAPVTPSLTWVHQTDGSQTEAPADTYQIYLHKDEGNGVYTQILFEAFDAGAVCMGLSCAVDLADILPSWGLLSGDYEWWVGAYYDDGAPFAWSGGDTFIPATFSVTVPPATLPDAITVDPRQGRPLISWADDGNTLWAQIWIGPNPIGAAYFEWIERDGDPEDAIPDFACAENICTFAPPINFTDAGNPYQVWMQFWSPGGFSSGGTDAAGAPSWKQGDNLTLPTMAPAVPTNVDVATSPDFVVSWDAVANATWYEVAPSDGSDSVWSLGYDLSEDCGNAAGVCTISLPSVMVDAGVPFTVRVRAWGPGGMGEYAVFTFTPG